MKIFTGNPCGNYKDIDKLKEYDLGVMLSVGKNGRGIKALKKEGVHTAIDNGAFMAFEKGFPFNPTLFWKLLGDAFLDGSKPEFIVCPDIVAGGLKSLEFSKKWATEKLVGSQVLALAVQDGMEPKHISDEFLANFSQIFVGGSIDWKWQTAKTWVDFAHSKGKKCHIGRCGTYDRLCEARDIGADSVDSTSFVRNKSWHILDKFLGLGEEENLLL